MEAETSSRTPANRTDTFLVALAAGRWWAVLAVFLAFAALYLLTQVGNVGDTDDVYYFAYLVENFPLNYVGDPRLILYKALMQWLYHGQALVGLDFSGLQIMRGFSALCGAAALVVFYRLLARDLGIRPFAAAVATLLLGFSYGFWRYAIEAEVYIPAILMLLIAFRWLYRLESRAEMGPLGMAAVGIFSALAVLLYQPNVIPLALAFSLVLLRRGQCCRLMVYGLVAAAVVIAGYYIGFRVYQTHPMGLATFEEFMAQRSLEFVVWPFDADNVKRATLGGSMILLHDFISANWLFAHDWIGLEVQELFAYEWFIEKQYTARQGGWLVWPPLLVLPLLLVLGFHVLVRARPWNPRRLLELRTLPYLLWVLFSGLVIWRLNPYGPEAWIMLLPPLVVLLALLVIDGAVRAGLRRVLLVAVVLVAFHNASSGIGIVHDRLSEYAVAKTQWIMEHAGPQDVVLVVDDNPLFMTLNYRSDAQIVPLVLEGVPIVAEGLLTGRWRVRLASELSRDFRVVMLEDFFRETLAKGGRIIFSSDFFEGSRRRPYTDITPRELELLVRLRDRLTKVWEDPELGEVYVLDRPLTTPAGRRVIEDLLR